MVGLRRLRVGCGTVGLIAAGFGWMPEGLAESFHLKSGDVVVGKVLQATRNTVTLHDGGAVKPTSLGQIEKVVLKLADGSELAGEFLTWTDGVFEIRSEGQVMRVRDGEVIEETSVAVTSEADASAADISVAKTVADETAVVITATEKTRSVTPVAPVSEAETEPAPQPGSPKPTPLLSVAMQGLPELALKNGKVVLARIIHATGSIVTLRRYEGGVVPTSRAQIAAVRFVGEDGEIINGRFVDWNEGVYRLQTEDRDVLASLSDEAANAGPPAVLLAEPSEPLPIQQSAQPSVAQAVDEPVVATIDSADAAVSPAPSIDDDMQVTKPEEPAAQAVPADEPDVPVFEADERPELTEETSDLAEETSDPTDTTGAGGPVSETAVAGLADPEAALTDRSEEQPEPALANAPHLVRPKVAPVDEDGDTVVFEFHLDHPAERPLVILYAATDDTAKAGEDFEAKSGVITFNAGSAYAEVVVPLIDDQEGETSEQFHLFLSGDPETVQFSQRQIPATINDND